MTACGKIGIQIASEVVNRAVYLKDDSNAN